MQIGILIWYSPDYQMKAYGYLCHGRGLPIHEANIPESKPFIIIFNISLTRGHPSNKARLSIPQEWPKKRGTMVDIYVSKIFFYRLISSVFKVRCSSTTDLRTIGAHI